MSLTCALCGEAKLVHQVASYTCRMCSANTSYCFTCNEKPYVLVDACRKAHESSECTLATIVKNMAGNLDQHRRANITLVPPLDPSTE